MAICYEIGMNMFFYTNICMLHTYININIFHISYIIVPPNYTNITSTSKFIFLTSTLFREVSEFQTEKTSSLNWTKRQPKDLVSTGLHPHWWSSLPCHQVHSTNVPSQRYTPGSLSRRFFEKPLLRGWFQRWRFFGIHQPQIKGNVHQLQLRRHFGGASDSHGIHDLFSNGDEIPCPFVIFWNRWGEGHSSWSKKNNRHCSILPVNDSFKTNTTIFLASPTSNFSDVLGHESGSVQQLAAWQPLSGDSLGGKGWKKWDTS